ncbi:hypothetical protein DICPUDRAFT_149214 [Dictyostelium purpureum]|uniref:Uncharacterized protein n=1 Tax=Dictyostelium purpureum TaxID=5786 RepID=F0ZD40_DICPU|nr:uncharacterized protein DICPUDRAFT_149214 [Dictyostelium purpureum]EGC38134.1 hypothetical protein DICPUDRAFT_149214 [Dictyostelium purpureum]|eukprot:XP_003285348.1 hypothetical protein DICPUDRAFT_149214 [Dictyostelium purpureum]
MTLDNIYPPCISFKDAGDRVRDFIDKNNAINNLYIFLHINENQTELKDPKYLGIINGVNEINIKVMGMVTSDEKFKAILSGGNSESFFQSDSSKLSISIEGINFVNWNNPSSFILDAGQEEFNVQHLKKHSENKSKKNEHFFYDTGSIDQELTLNGETLPNFLNDNEDANNDN